MLCAQQVWGKGAALDRPKGRRGLMLAVEIQRISMDTVESLLRDAHAALERVSPGGPALQLKAEQLANLIGSAPPEDVEERLFEIGDIAVIAAAAGLAAAAVRAWWPRSPRPALLGLAQGGWGWDW